MKIFFISLFALACISSTLFAQDSTKTNDQKEKNNQYFVDEDGDGYNDNAPDHDGDGIPNGLDPDWQKLKKEKRKNRFVDLDGDGIDDNFQNNENQEGKGTKQFNEGGSSMEGKGKNQKAFGPGQGLRNGSDSGTGPGSGQGSGQGQKRNGNKH